MKEYYQSTGLGTLCRLFGKTRQALYERDWARSNDQMQELIILEVVKQIRKALPRIGTLKLHSMSRDQLLLHGITIGRDSLYTLLRQHDLLIKRRKKYVKTTDSWHRYHKWPNLAASIKPNAANQLWVSDITYLRVKNGFIYLSLVTDAYSRKIVGYHLSQQLKAQSCVITLDKAISSLKSSDQSLVHHSDRGIQYCCDQYINKLLENNIKISMTQSGSPYENAVAERINGILKEELGLNKTFASYSEAIAPTHKAIDYYNRIRPHMSCGYLTPEKAHSKTGELKKRWKSKKSVKQF